MISRKENSRLIPGEDSSAIANVHTEESIAYDQSQNTGGSSNAAQSVVAAQVVQVHCPATRSKSFATASRTFFMNSKRLSCDSISACCLLSQNMRFCLITIGSFSETNFEQRVPLCLVTFYLPVHHRKERYIYSAIQPKILNDHYFILHLRTVSLFFSFSYIEPTNLEFQGSEFKAVLRS